MSGQHGASPLATVATLRKHSLDAANHLHSGTSVCRAKRGSLSLLGSALFLQLPLWSEI